MSQSLSPGPETATDGFSAGALNDFSHLFIAAHLEVERVKTLSEEDCVARG